MRLKLAEGSVDVDDDLIGALLGTTLANYPLIEAALDIEMDDPEERVLQAQVMERIEPFFAACRAVEAELLAQLDVG